MIDLHRGLARPAMWRRVAAPNGYAGCTILSIVLHRTLAAAVDTVRHSTRDDVIGDVPFVLTEAIKEAQSFSSRTPSTTLAQVPPSLATPPAASRTGNSSTRVRSACILASTCGKVRCTQHDGASSCASVMCQCCAGCAVSAEARWG